MSLFGSRLQIDKRTPQLESFQSAGKRKSTLMREICKSSGPIHRSRGLSNRSDPATGTSKNQSISRIPPVLLGGSLLLSPDLARNLPRDLEGPPSGHPEQRPSTPNGLALRRALPGAGSSTGLVTTGLAPLPKRLPLRTQVTQVINRTPTRELHPSSRNTQPTGRSKELR